MAEGRYSGGFGGTLQKELLISLQSTSEREEGTSNRAWVHAGLESPANLETRMMDPRHSAASSARPSDSSREDVDGSDRDVDAFVGWTRPIKVESTSTVSNGALPANVSPSPGPKARRDPSGSPQSVASSATASSARTQPSSHHPNDYPQYSEMRGGPTAMHVDSSALAVNSKMRRNWRKTRRKTAADDDESSSGSSDEEYLNWEPEQPRQQQQHQHQQQPRQQRQQQQQGSARRSVQHFGAAQGPAHHGTAQQGGQQAPRQQGQEQEAMLRQYKVPLVLKPPPRGSGEGRAQRNV